MKDNRYLEYIKIIGFALPFIISFFVWLSSLSTQVELLKQSDKVASESIIEIAKDIKEIKKDVVVIKVKLSSIDSKSDVKLGMNEKE